MSHNTFSGNGIDVRFVNDVRDGTFHHVAITYDGSGSASGINAYVDGNLLSQPTPNNDNLSGTILNDKALRIGSNEGATILYDGQMDEVQFFNSELTANEAAFLSNS